MLLYMDDKFLLHHTGRHPECAARLEHIHARLAVANLPDSVTRVPVPRAKDSDVLRVHSQQHVDSVQQLAETGGGRIDADTVVSPDSADVAWLAAGAGIDAVTRVINGEDQTALCLVRPPGHHAVPTAAMGFCLLGNVAIAARTAIDRLSVDRVLIVDWDVHHGNGTQDTFYDDERVTFFSVHRHPFYPGTGLRSETGRGKGLGSTVNLPLSFGISRRDYLTAFETALAKAADQCRPDLVLISAGFDAHAQDPIGSLGLETEDFETLTNLVRQTADVHSKGRIVSMLEGGYHPERLAECVELHLRTLNSSAERAEN